MFAYVCLLRWIAGQRYADDAFLQKLNLTSLTRVGRVIITITINTMSDPKQLVEVSNIDPLRTLILVVHYRRQESRRICKVMVRILSQDKADVGKVSTR